MAYPIVGILLSLGIPGFLLALRAVSTGHALSRAALRAELSFQPVTYAYLAVTTMAILASFGWILGRREDLLQRATGVDALTGLANRRRLDSEFVEELNRTARYGTPLALLLVDLDRLKQINDTLGHRAGDQALQLVAEALRSSSRATDLVARWGGDEFVVLAGNTTATEAMALAHRVRTRLRRLCLDGRANPRLRARTGAVLEGALMISVSVGAADLERAEEPTLEAMMAAADQALYRAKEEGRDRVMAAPVVTRSARLKLMAAPLRDERTEHA